MQPQIESLLGELYSATRGSPSANSMTDAREAFEAGDYRLALQLVESSRDQFAKSHRKLVRRNLNAEAASGRSSQSAIKKAEHGKNKVLAALDKFDEQVIPALRRLANSNSGNPERTGGTQPPSARSDLGDTSSRKSNRPATSLTELPATFRENFEAAGSDRQQQWDTVTWYFDVRQVMSTEDIRENAYYCFVGKHTIIIRTSSRTSDFGPVGLRHAFTEQVLKSKSREELLHLGRNSSLYSLSPKESPSDPLAAGSAASNEQHGAGGPPASGRRDAAVTRAFFQTLIGDVDRASRVLGDFGRLHGVQVPFQIDTTVISNADRGAFRTGDDGKARSDVEVIQSMVGAAVSSARGVIQKREHEFNRIKMDIPGSQRQKMLQSFAPAKQAVQTVERALQRLIQGLDIAVHLGEAGHDPADGSEHDA